MNRDNSFNVAEFLIFIVLMFALIGIIATGQFIANVIT